MDKPLANPDFLQAVGEMTVSFALLEDALVVVLRILDPDTELSDIAEMNFSRKVVRLSTLAGPEFRRLRSMKFTARDFDRLKNDLTDIAKHRNSLNHDFWTMESNGRLTVKSLKKNKGIPERYPTPQKIRKLAARTWAVRRQLADVVNEYLALKRAESQGKTKQG